MPPDYELLEQAAFEIVVQALTDYLAQARQIFKEETDKAQDIAEDVLREAIESMGVSGFQERLYGKVDFKKAVYVFLPEAYPVALMVDAKAEKSNGSATIQMSQTSMQVRFTKQDGSLVEEAGNLQQTITRNERELHVVSIVVKYVYEEAPQGYNLKEIATACIPNGRLQDRYNPDPSDTIWRAGRHAPTLGEDFRVRLDFNKLQQKASWRVRHIPVGSGRNQPGT